MSDELTPAPRIEGEFWVIDGRRFQRLRGAEEAPVAEDTPAENAAPVDGTPAAEPEADPEYTPERARGLHAELTKLQQQQAEQMRLLDRARLGDAEAARELGFEFAEDEEVPDQEDDEQSYGEADTADPVARQWIEQQQVKENLSLFNSHLDRLAGGPDVLDDWDRQALLNASIAGGFNEQATETAFKQWKERGDAREKAQFEKWKKSKPSSRVSPGGTGVTQEDLPLDATHAQRVAFMHERMQLANEQ